MTNSEAFLDTIAAVERLLRKRADTPRGTPFQTMVHLAARSDAAIRQYRDDLREYADLRNAIRRTAAAGSQSGQRASGCLAGGTRRPDAQEWEAVAQRRLSDAHPEACGGLRPIGADRRGDDVLVMPTGFGWVAPISPIGRGG